MQNDFVFQSLDSIPVFYNSMYENTYLYEQAFMDYYDGNRIIRMLG
jgi:hypothetical protein